MGGLLRLLLLAIAIWLIISGVRRLLLPSSLARRDTEEDQEQEDVLLVQDPQCGRFILKRDAARVSFQGQILHFCSSECHDLYTRSQATEGQEKRGVTFLGPILLTTLRQARRLVVIVVGFTVLLMGVALLVLPGPAVVVIPVGLAILATEFVWAGRLLNRMKQATGRIGSVFSGKTKDSQSRVGEDREHSRPL
jgi:YHS domain-containing protein